MGTRGDRRELEGDIVHELRGAVHNVLGQSSLLAGLVVDERHRRSVAVIVTSARRAGAVLEAAQLLGEDEAAAPDGEVDVAGAVERALEHHRVSLDALGVPVTVAGVAPRARGGQRALELALDLVLCWATTRASRVDGLRLHLGTAGPGATLAIRVAAPLDPDRDTGLHLAIQVARRAAADVEVDRAAGTIELRFASLQLGAPRGVRGDPVLDRAVERMEHVLVVDDDPGARELVLLALDGTCRVSAAATVAEAEAIMASDPVDVLLVDHHIGPDSGLELLGRVLASVDAPRAFLVTGERGETVGALARAVGACLITKPFDIDALARLVGARGPDPVTAAS